jgi:hemerythrin-like domain-containing protein
MAVNTWWQTPVTTRTESFDKLTKIIDQVNTLKNSLDTWKKNWNDNSLAIASLYAENLDTLLQPNNTSVEAIQRQLKLRTKMVSELRAFLDQEDLKTIKFNKRHAELVEELTKRKKKKL